MKTAIEIIEDPESLFKFNNENELEFSNLNLNKLISKNPKTPFFVLSIEKLKKQYGKFKVLFSKISPDIEITYSVKTNPSKSIVKTLNENGVGFTVSYFSELKKLDGINKNKIILNNPGLSRKDIENIIKEKIGLVVVDSISQLKKIENIAREKNENINVLLRINTGVVGSSKYGASESMLGISIDELRENLDFVLSLKNTLVKGIHNHLTSQNNSRDLWKRNIKILYEVIDDLLEKGLKIEILDIGGGYPVKYDENVLSLENITKYIKKPLIKLQKKIPNLKLILEPGRFLVAESTILVTKVEAVKSNAVVVDTSAYSGFLDSILVNIEFPIITPRKPGKNLKEFIIRGNCMCTSDVIRKKALLPENIKEGDHIIWLNTGAYMINTDLFETEKCPAYVIRGGDTKTL